MTNKLTLRHGVDFLAVFFLCNNSSGIQKANEWISRIWCCWIYISQIDIIDVCSICVNTRNRVNQPTHHSTAKVRNWVGWIVDQDISAAGMKILLFLGPGIKSKCKQERSLLCDASLFSRWRLISHSCFLFSCGCEWVTAIWLASTNTTHNVDYD